MAMQKVSLTNSSNQSFIHTVKGVDYKFSIRWNATQGTWILDVQDNVSGDSLMFGAAVLSGANILEILPPYTLEGYYLSDTGLTLDPTRNNLADGHFYIGDVPL